MSSPRRIPVEQDMAACVPRAVPSAPRLSAIRPMVRRGLSRLESAAYLGISPSKFDELRKANRIGPPKVLDGRLIFTVERLDEFLDALPDEGQTRDDDWTASL
jgi:hypothetical protein